jgi:hypothetical protein
MKRKVKRHTYSYEQTRAVLLYIFRKARFLKLENYFGQGPCLVIQKQIKKSKNAEVSFLPDDVLDAFCRSCRGDMRKK